MLHIFSGLKKFIVPKSLKIDSFVARLHYKYTLTVLILFSIIISSKQYCGNPIHCLTDSGTDDVIDSYCWIQGTYILPHKPGKLGTHSAYHGVRTSITTDQTSYKKYYQWVCFVLVLQAIFFYTPRYLWKILEGGRIRALSADLKFGSISNKNVHARCRILSQYFIRNANCNNFYYTKFLTCEFLHLVNVVGQIFFMDLFLDGEFLTYGWDVLKFTQMNYHDRVDPMAEVFPVVTKCNFYSYGHGGGIQTKDAMCLLPLNVVNEKIYVFLWFWFIILAGITGLWMILQVLMLLVPSWRHAVLKWKIGVVDAGDMSSLCKNFSVGNWFLLYQISQNVDMFVLKEVVENIVEDLKAGKNHSHVSYSKLSDDVSV